jgi:hypothetical protein
MGLRRGAEAGAAWQTALALAKQLEPGVRESRVRRIQRKLAGR